MKFTLTIETINEDSGYDMIVRVLKTVARDVEFGFTEETIRDGNGNRIGEWRMTSD